jgi:hypothetical protein
VDKALQNQLMVILDLHNYEDIGQNLMKFEPRLFACWEQIAAHFKDAPDALILDMKMVTKKGERATNLVKYSLVRMAKPSLL